MCVRLAHARIRTLNANSASFVGRIRCDDSIFGFVIIAFWMRRHTAHTHPRSRCRSNEKLIIKCWGGWEKKDAKKHKSHLSPALGGRISVPLRNIQMANGDLLCVVSLVCMCNVSMPCQSKSFNIFSIMTKSTITQNGWIRRTHSHSKAQRQTEEQGGEKLIVISMTTTRTTRTMAHYEAEAIHHHRCSMCVCVCV